MHRGAGYAAVAEVRAREIWTRLVLAVVIGATAYGLAPSVWPAVWFGLVVASQGFDWLICRPLRREPERALLAWERALVVVSTFVNTAIYSSLAAYLWFEGGAAGQVFSMIQVAGGLLHVTLHMHQARPLLFAAVIPHSAYFLGLPLSAALTGHPWMGVGVIAGLLYCAHLAKAVKQTRDAQAGLRAAGAEAERASAAKSDFLATVSHEIRTPMNAVISAAELLRRTDLTDEQREHVAMLLDAGDVLMGLLNDVLDLSKIEAGKMRLESADVDLPARLEALRRLWEPRAQDKGVKLVLETRPGVPAGVRTDPLRLQQILFNLLSNALKFTEGGEVRLTAGRDDDRLWFEVSDTGCGMDAATMERIFAGFEQAEAGTTRRYGGSGLGLAISRRLANLMDGDLTARSQPGAGSVFRLEIPYEPAVAPVAGPALPDGAESGGLNGLKVLVAEDHAVNRRILSLFLEPLGCRLTLVENGAEAVAIAEAEAFDVLIMDMQMPVMDGLEAARAIRAGAGPNAKAGIIALTANALDHHRAAWEAVGANAFLTKPIDPRALNAALLAASAGERRATRAA